MDSNNSAIIPQFKEFCKNKKQNKRIVNETNDNKKSFDDGTSYENRSVKTFRSYTKLLEEGAKNLKNENYNEVLDMTLNSIEREAGGLNLDDVIKVAQQNVGKSGDTTILLKKYISEKAKSAMSTIDQERVLSAVGLDAEQRGTSQKLQEQTLDLLCKDVVADVLEKIVKENKLRR